MKRKKIKIVGLFLVIFVLVFAASLRLVKFGLSKTVEEQQLELRQELQNVEEQIVKYQADLKNLKGQKNTLQNKIKQLKSEQDTLNLQIKGTGLKINDLSKALNDAQISINLSQDKVDELKTQIGHFLKLIYEQDSQPVLVSILNGGHLSDIFTQIKNYSQITEGLRTLLDRAKLANYELTLAKQKLSDRQEETENLLAIQNLQQNELTDSVGQQNTLLKETKGKESNYQSALVKSKKQVQAIRNRLYQLLEVGKQINFSQAVSLAEWASGQTGVRPAFLLSILTQESNLGRNVGTCNRAGDPPSKSYKVVMNPTRDQPLFLKITDELGRNPNITPISCPMRDKNGNRIGWGGAMGPAQFIPSTWMGYKNKVRAITGKSADPWDIRDAFLASAIKLAAGGATTKSGEWAAAMRYFSGSTNPAYSFYGDNVVARADKYQADIDEMKK